MIIYIFVYVMLVVIIFFLLHIGGISSGSESFTNNDQFLLADNTQFAGMNLLGVNSNDGHFGTSNQFICQQICSQNPECKGYSYYQPGQRCYMFASGDFVPERPGFYSGKKVSR